MRQQQQKQVEGRTEKSALRALSTARTDAPRDATMRVLPADVYDALELSALAYGGIGAGADRDRHGNPLCMLGHRWQVVVTNEDAVEWFALGKTVERPITGRESDDAVHRINRRCSFHPDSRVPFDEWCAELHVVRGES